MLSDQVDIVVVRKVDRARLHNARHVAAAQVGIGSGCGDLEYATNGVIATERDRTAAAAKADVFAASIADDVDRTALRQGGGSNLPTAPATGGGVKVATAIHGQGNHSGQIDLVRMAANRRHTGTVSNVVVTRAGDQLAVRQGQVATDMQIGIRIAGCRPGIHVRHLGNRARAIQREVTGYQAIVQDGTSTIGVRNRHITGRAIGSSVQCQAAMQLNWCIVGLGDGAAGGQRDR